LRPLASEMVSNRLTSFVEGRAVEGQNLFLEVSTPAGGSSIIDCTWTSPDGTIYFVDEDADVKAEGKHFDNLLNLTEFNSPLYTYMTP
jgi:hypothetical protein